MAITPKPLAQVDLTVTTEVTAYTTPASTTTTVGCLILHNRSNATVAVKVYHRLSADVATGNKNQFYDVDVPARQTFVANINKVMAAGDSLRAVAAVANAITIQADGVEVA